MINTRRHALLRMKLQGIVPLHQILDNENSQAYKYEIRNTGMTYQIVPPDNHCHNIAERAIQTRKNHLSAFSEDQQQFSRYTFGAKKSHRLSGSSSSSVNPMSNPISRPTPMCTATITITQRHSCPSAWIPYSITRPIGEDLSPNTAGRATSLEINSNITVGGKFGCYKPAQPESQQPLSTDTGISQIPLSPPQTL